LGGFWSFDDRRATATLRLNQPFFDGTANRPEISAVDSPQNQINNLLLPDRFSYCRCATVKSSALQIVSCRMEKEGLGMGRLRWSLAAVLAVCMSSAALAEEIGWQEAVARLAYERTKAETCVKELKKYGDKAAISRGEDAYNNVKAEYDAIVSGLTVALAKKGEPESLPDLEVRMQRGFDARQAFCKSVQPLIPATTGQKSPIADIVGGVVGPVIEALKAIYLRSKDDDAQMRKTIQTQLEATSWLAFASISSSP
jgi:hypothetical protein